MHHEIARVLWVVKVLKQKARAAMPQVSEVLVRPRDCEPQILIKLLGERKIPRRHKRLDFDYVQLAHCHLLSVGPGTTITAGRSHRDYAQPLSAVAKSPGCPIL